MTETIAICGGIGSGKSIVSRILTVLGFDVYDCDREAKRLMDADDAIKDAIAREIAGECIVDGTIDRPRLAGIVFSDSVKLEALNAIVHAAVRRHLAAWPGPGALNSSRPPSFIRAASTGWSTRSGKSQHLPTCG